MRDQHYIQGKWVDCKSAIPIPEMKELHAAEELTQRKVKLDIPIPLPIPQSMPLPQVA